MMYQPPAQAELTHRRGTSVTELAVVLPIVLVFVLGAIDFAQVMFAYGTVSEAPGRARIIVHEQPPPACGPPMMPTFRQSFALCVRPRLNVPSLTRSPGSNAVGSPAVSRPVILVSSVGRLLG